MHMLADFQRRFAAGLLKAEPVESCPALDARGFGIHARNSRFSLRMALQDAFPVTRRLVGSDFFRVMADSFVAAHPPKQGWLPAYGGGLPDFIAKYEPSVAVTYLPHVAQLEWARVRASNAPDTSGLDLRALAGLAPDLLPDLRLSLHGAAALVCSPFPVFDIWQAHRHSDDESLAPINLAKGAQTVLISRPAALEVGVALLSAGDAALLTFVAGGSSLGSACEAALRVETEYDLGARLGDLTGLRALAALAV